MPALPTRRALEKGRRGCGGINNPRCTQATLAMGCHRRSRGHPPHTSPRILRRRAHIRRRRQKSQQIPRLRSAGTRTQEPARRLPRTHLLRPRRSNPLVQRHPIVPRKPRRRILNRSRQRQRITAATPSQPASGTKSRTQPAPLALRRVSIDRAGTIRAAIDRGPIDGVALQQQVADRIGAVAAAIKVVEQRIGPTGAALG